MRKYMADPPTVRSYTEVRRFFADFELFDPSVVPVHLWQPADHDQQQDSRQPSWCKPGDEDEPFWMYAGVARRP